MPAKGCSVEDGSAGTSVLYWGESIRGFPDGFRSCFSYSGFSVLLAVWTSCCSVDS